MKTLSIILTTLFFALTLTAPFNTAINTRTNLPLFLLFIVILGVANIVVATIGFPGEAEYLEGTDL